MSDNKTTAAPYPGVDCYLLAPHVWAGNCGQVLRFERYGPGGRFEGWRVRLRTGEEVYARTKDIYVAKNNIPI